MPEKDFDGWNKIKKTIDDMNAFLPIKEGEIWWCSIGENVGIEICGKGGSFSRPVLVFKKLSRYGFLGIPLTSQEHTGSWYSEFVFKNRRQFAVLAQVRVFSINRLTDRMGTLTESDYANIKHSFDMLYK